MKILASVLIGCFLIFGCAHEKTVCIPVSSQTGSELRDSHVECHTFVPVGIADENEKRNPAVRYEISVGNIVWSVLLSETIVVPIVLLGWYLW